MDLIEQTETTLSESEAIQKVREEEEMAAFYDRKEQFDKQLSSVKRQYGTRRTLLRKNLVWLAFAFLVVCVAYVLLKVM